ncbi:MAG: xylulokinase [Christensenellaceae bacterium]|jgi:xylulokinase
MTQYIIAHDLGTSGDKVSLFTTEGKFVKTKTVGYQTNYSNGNWAEQNPDDWWNAFCTSTKELLEGIDNKQVLCVAFGGTFPNCLCVDKEGNALYPAMIWQDARATEEAEEVAKALPKELIESAWGYKMLAYETLTRLLWLRKNRPEVYENTYKVFVGAQDYIIMKLTGNAVTEKGYCVISGFMNVEHTDWSDEVLDTMGIPRSMMPELKNRTDIVGEIQAGFEELTGLAPGTKIVMGCGDTGCTSIGAGLLNEGDAYMNGGTSAGIIVKARPGDGDVGGLTASSGSSLSWLKNTICRMEQMVADESGRDVYDIINEEIAKAPIGSSGVLFHPYLAGERAPRNNAKLKGSFVGISLTTTREDIMRSVIEGIGLNINVILQRAISKGYPIESLLIVGGLGKGEVVRQIFADIMNVELRTLKYMDETATVGAAVLGGIALGIYEDERAVGKFMEISATTYPNKENHEKYKEIMPWFERVFEALEPVYNEM